MPDLKRQRLLAEYCHPDVRKGLVLGNYWWQLPNLKRHELLVVIPDVSLEAVVTLTTGRVWFWATGGGNY